MLKWMNRVADYLHHLQNTAHSVTDALVALEHATKEARSTDIQDAAGKLGSLLSDLQMKLQEREDLLDDFSVDKERSARLGVEPSFDRPNSLQVALSRVKHPLAAELAESCDQIGADLLFVQRRAVGLFIGQYHLTHVTEELMRLMSGVSAQPVTYDQADDEHGGGFLDRAA